MPTYPETLQLMGQAAILYRRDDVTEATAQAYHAFLGSLTKAEMAEAIARHVQTSQFFPTVADILRHHAESQTGNMLSGEEAWGEVKNAIRRTGFYGIPQFSSQEVADAVASIGWETLCSMEITESGIYHAQFVRSYDAIRARSVRRVQLDTAPAVRMLTRGLLKTLPNNPEKTK